MEIPLIPEVILHVLLFCILCLHSNYMPATICQLATGIFFCGNKMRYTCPAAVGVPSNNPEVWSFFNDIPFLSINRTMIACHNINNVTAAAIIWKKII